jgi:dienelactone hydrolase
MKSLISSARARTASLRRFPPLALLFLLAPSLGNSRPLDPILPGDVQTRVNELAYTPWDGRATELPADSTKRCIYTTVRLMVVDPQNGEAHDLVLKVSRPDSKTPVPVMLIIPTIEGVTVLEPRMASRFCSAKIASVIADVNDPQQPTDLPSWGTEDKNNRRAIISIRTVLDYVERSPAFDPSKIGLMGLSLGGITTSMLAGLEPDRLKALVIAVGGSNLPYILSRSESEKVFTLRESRMKKLGWTDPTQYEDMLRQTVRYDPYYFSSRVRTDRVMMVMAQRDKSVPYLVQQEQYDIFGQPESMLFRGGHVTSLVELAFLYMGGVIDFVNKRFNNLSTPRVHQIIDMDSKGL